MKNPGKFTRNLISAFLLAAIACLNLAAQERRLLPIDEASKDASFKLFRDKLLDAVKRRDAKYVLSIVDPNIKNGFAGEDGFANFKKQWKINNAKSPFWDEMLFVLTHGGAFQREGGGRTFWAPYVYSNFPNNLDPFEHFAVTGDAVKLRANPSPTARVVGDLSYNIVKVDYEKSIKDKSTEGKYTWLNVKTLGGKQGFVSDKFVRNPVDYRAAFEKVRGRWKMTVFLAGD